MTTNTRTLSRKHPHHKYRKKSVFVRIFWAMFDRLLAGIFFFFCTQRIKLFRYVSHNYAFKTFLVSSCVFLGCCSSLNKQQEGKITNIKKTEKSRRWVTQENICTVCERVFCACVYRYLCTYVCMEVQLLLFFLYILPFNVTSWPGG